MSNRHTTQLPDPVYGSADAGGGIDPRRLAVSASDDGRLLHAHIGGIYIAMTEQNWRVLYATLESLDVPIPTYRINFDDTEGTAEMEVTA